MPSEILGRATFPVESLDSARDLKRSISDVLPGYAIVAIKRDSVKGFVLVSVEGKGLPEWHPGVVPWHFDSLSKLKSYIATGEAYAAARSLRKGGD